MIAEEKAAIREAVNAVDIDSDKLALGIWALMSDDDRALVCCGMIPSAWVSLLEAKLREKAQDVAREVFKARFGLETDLDIARKEFVDEFVRHCSGKVVRSLYGIAPMVV